ncbi:hypothetical protein PI124_g10551 [Phytophthora idaei]|nr:hypothetical protein PI124_g10551 [Phytophthora idaei]
MTKREAHEPARPAQLAGHWLRERKHVDYVRSVQGFTRDSSSDEDYIDDPFATTEDVANEGAEMKNLEVEGNDEGIAKPASATAAAADAGSGVAKCVDASKKDAIAVEAGVGNSDTLAAGSCNAGDGETVDVYGDEDKMDGPGDYIRRFVHTARASAELERAKPKKRPQSLRAKFASDKNGGDSEDTRPFKCIRNSLASSVTSATAINQQRAWRRTKTFEAREQIIKSRLVVVNVKPGLVPELGRIRASASRLRGQVLPPFPRPKLRNPCQEEQV